MKDKVHGLYRDFNYYAFEKYVGLTIAIVSTGVVIMGLKACGCFSKLGA